MTDRPLISYMVFSYKQEAFICDAIKSALEQTYEPMEIIFSDDCSPDRTFEIIKKEVDAYQGPHEIILNRNKKNMGIAAHINHVFQMANGKFFVLAAGDDISVPTRTEELVCRWQDKENPVDLVSSFFDNMDADGKPIVLTEELITENAVYLPDVKLPVNEWRCGATGACAGFSRKLYDKYGPLDPNIIAEDAIFPFRAWVESGIALIEKPLVRHRTHDESMYVIHKNINMMKNAESRHRVRRQGAANELARARSWLDTCQISGKASSKHLEAEFKQWIRLLELEWQAYDSGRIQALKAALLSLRCRMGLRFAMRISYRHVLGRH